MSSTGLLNQMHNGAEPSSNTQVLWGTNINANEVQTKMKNFINTFVELSDDPNDEAQYTAEPLYL